MKKTQSLCSVCGNELTTPFEKSRGKHEGCAEKSGGETMEK